MRRSTIILWCWLWTNSFALFMGLAFGAGGDVVPYTAGILIGYVIHMLVIRLQWTRGIENLAAWLDDESPPDEEARR
jgi:hypothetical protein